MLEGTEWHQIKPPYIRGWGCILPKTNPLTRTYILSLVIHTVLFLATTIPAFRVWHIGRSSPVMARILREYVHSESPLAVHSVVPDARPVVVESFTLLCLVCPRTLNCALYCVNLKILCQSQWGSPSLARCNVIPWYVTSLCCDGLFLELETRLTFNPPRSRSLPHTPSTWCTYIRPLRFASEHVPP